MTAVPEVLVQQLVQKHPISEGPIERRFGIYLYCRQQGKWIDYLTDKNEGTLDPFCPLKKVDESYPPTLLLHGDADEDVPFEQSVFMSEAEILHCTHLMGTEERCPLLLHFGAEYCLLEDHFRV